MNIRFAATAASLMTMLFTTTLTRADDTGTFDSRIAALLKAIVAIEPRTAINSATTPGDAANLHRITRPGSYYLTGNISPTASGQSAISIETNDVTIDLNGFTIDGSAAGAASGFVFTNSFRNLVVRNGAIANFSGYAFIGNVSSSAFIDLAILDNGSGGLELGVDADDCIARNVRVRAGSGEFGILLGDNSLVEDCVVRGSSVGIAVTSGIVSRCTVDSAVGMGISLGGGSVIDCRVNGVLDTSSFDSAAISVGGRGKVERCVASGSAVGVFVGGAVSIVDCEFLHCVRGVNAPNFGGSGARIEGNLFVGSTTAAVSLQTAGHFVVGNRFRQNTANIVAGSGNVIGEMVSLGASGGTLTAANSHSAANIAY